MAQNSQYNPALGTLALADSLDFEALGSEIVNRNIAVKTNCKSLKLAMANQDKLCRMNKYYRLQRLNRCLLA